MKKLALLLFTASLHLVAGATLTYNLRGTDFQVDTLYHAAIGPGTTQTSLRMTAGTRGMNVFYSRIDLTNPYVTLRTVTANDRYNGVERVSDMAIRKSEPGARYFLGINGDFFITSGQTSRGESYVGVPCGTTMADGVIYRGQNNDYYTQFVLDTSKQPHVGTAVFSGSLTTSSGATAPLAGVNADADYSGIVLYNDRYLTGTDQFYQTCEVAAHLAPGESFAIGQPFRLIVDGTPSTSGDLTIPEGGFVIHGQEGLNDFVQGLHDGDEVTVNIGFALDGQQLVPEQIISGFPKSVSDGVVTETEWMLDEFSTRQPVTEVGIADDGKTIIFIVIDGRSSISSGARTTEVADLMRQLGCTQVVNFDSGGSTTFYTSALGIRNRCSDGVERPDSNGLFAVCLAPDDDQVASIAFVDWAMTLPKYGAYTPHFYGYNRYGMLIDTDLQGVTLSCDESLGNISADGSTFVAAGQGVGALTAHWGDLTASLDVMIVGDLNGLALDGDSILLDGWHDVPVPMHNTVDGVEKPVNPSALSWTSDNPAVVTVDDAGVMHGFADGTAMVTGTAPGLELTLKVIVERPVAHVMAGAGWNDPAVWSTSQAGGKNGALEATDGHLRYSYTGSSGRVPRITLSGTYRLWSRPDTLRLTINAGNAPVTGLVLGMRSAQGKLQYATISDVAFAAGQPTVVDVPLAAYYDCSQFDTYPVTISSVQLSMGASTTGEAYWLEWDALETVYNCMPTLVPGDVNGDDHVDGLDLNVVINIVLGKAAPTARADIDNNGSVDGSDINMLINLILSK